VLGLLYSCINGLPVQRVYQTNLSKVIYLIDRVKPELDHELVLNRNLLFVESRLFINVVGGVGRNLVPLHIEILGPILRDDHCSLTGPQNVELSL